MSRRRLPPRAPAGLPLRTSAGAKSSPPPTFYSVLSAVRADERSAGAAAHGHGHRVPCCVRHDHAEATPVPVSVLCPCSPLSLPYPHVTRPPPRPPMPCPHPVLGSVRLRLLSISLCTVACLQVPGPRVRGAGAGRCGCDWQPLVLHLPPRQVCLWVSACGHHALVPCTHKFIPMDVELPPRPIVATGLSSRCVVVLFSLPSHQLHPARTSCRL